MNQIPNIFADYFKNWDITLPPEAIENRLPVKIQSRGWTIQYQFGSNDHGDFLDFYASHRMTNDRHVRIYETGETKSLPAFQELIIYPADADEAEKERIEKEYSEHNRRIAEELRRKGFL